MRRFIPVEDWEDPRHRRGVAGERLALAWLTACGWQIEAHRFRMGRHDVDLIARRGNVVAFIEVKTRVNDAFGSPLEAIGWQKRRAIGRVAEAWRLRHGRVDDEYRFDVVTILGSGADQTLEHIPDAWRL
jgi:putative endonuclease